MALFRRAVELFPYVFHPSTVLGAGILLIVHYEWRRQSAERSELWKRIGAFAGVGVLAFVPTAAFFLLRSGTLSQALQGSSWKLDMMVAAGVYIAAGTLWFFWRRFDWGSLVPDFAVILAAATVPYTVLSPFWDVSGHVVVALPPLLYLALVDRRYWPLLAIPVLMVPDRVLVNAHTWAQSIGAFVLATVITIGLFSLQGTHRVESETTSATS